MHAKMYLNEVESGDGIRMRPVAAAAGGGNPPPPGGGDLLIRADPIRADVFRNVLSRAENGGIVIFDVPFKIETGLLRNNDPNLSSGTQAVVSVNLAEALTKDSESGCPIPHPMVAKSKHMPNGAEYINIVFSAKEMAKIQYDGKKAYAAKQGHEMKNVSPDRLSVNVLSPMTYHGCAGVNSTSILKGVCKVVGLNHLLTNGRGRMTRNGMSGIFSDIDVISRTYCDFVKEQLKNAVENGCSGVMPVGGDVAIKNTTFPPLSKFGVKLDNTDGNLVMVAPYDKAQYNKTKDENKVDGMTLGQAVASMATAIDKAWLLELRDNKNLLLTDSQKAMAYNLHFDAALAGVLDIGQRKSIDNVMQIQCSIKDEENPFASALTKAAKTYSKDPAYGWAVITESGEVKSPANKIDAYGKDLIKEVTAIYNYGDNNNPPPPPEVAVAEREEQSKKLVDIAQKPEKARVTLPVEEFGDEETDGEEDTADWGLTY